ncbi:MAG: RNA polymerase sigma factor [Alistipes sp.]|nr:RNA polymerase sigma factor [Alistipes sp.]
MEIREYTTFDDRALTQMVVEGDSRAFDTLFTRHRDKIYAMLVKRSNNADDVEDLLQEAFMKAFINIDRYNPRYDFGAWICAIAKNAFVDFNRSRRTKALDPKQNLPLDGNYTVSQTPMPTPETPEESIIHAQQRAQIERYISQLPENYRRLFQLRFLDEYSYEEIAEKLNMKLGTVKTQIFRIRAMMCRMVTEGESRF